jgi:ABC-type dipeptide/oligopeptide/nickel transport system permease component
VQGAVLLAALAFVITNLLVDMVYAAVDPRIRYG